MPDMTRELRTNLFRLAASSAISIVLGLVGRELARSMRRTQTAKKIDRKLDQAIEDTMDCSDPITQY